MSDSASPVAQDTDSPTYRRRYARIATAFPITFSLDGSETTQSGESNDLGGGGVRLSTEEDLPLGVTLVLRFELPGHEREIVVRGRLVLSFFNAERQRFQHGVAFTHIDPSDQQAIVAYVTDEVRRIAEADDSLAP